VRSIIVFAKNMGDHEPTIVVHDVNKLAKFSFERYNTHTISILLARGPIYLANNQLKAEVGFRCAFY